MLTTKEAKAQVTRLKNAISAKVTRLSKREKGSEVKEDLKKVLELMNNENLELDGPT